MGVSRPPRRFRSVDLPVLKNSRVKLTGKLKKGGVLINREE